MADNKKEKKTGFEAVGSKLRTENVGDREQKSMLEELFLLFLAGRSLDKLKKMVGGNEKLSKEAWQLITNRIKGNVDNAAQQQRVQEITGLLEQDKLKQPEMEELQKKVYGLLEDQDLALQQDKTKKKDSKRRQETDEVINNIKKTAVKHKERQDFREYWEEYYKELRDFGEQLSEKQQVKVRESLAEVKERIASEIELNLKEPLSENRRNEIKGQIENLYQESTKKSTVKRGKRKIREDMRQRGEELVMAKGSEIVAKFLSFNKSGQAEKFFKNMNAEDYYKLIRFLELLQQRGQGEEFGAVYEVVERIKRSWVDERAISAQKMLDQADNERIHNNITNKQLEIPKFDTPEQAVRWMMNNNVTRGVEGDFASEGAQKNFTGNMEDLLKLQKELQGGRMGQERLRNINYDLVPGFNKLIEAELKKRGLFDRSLGSTIEIGQGGAFLNKNLSPESKKIVEQVLFQLLLKEQRKLVSESVERASMYYDERAQIYMTLLSIGGVDTTIKDTATNHMVLLQLQYAFRNNFVDEKVYEQVMSVYARQGPEYRLHEELKRNEVFEIKNKEGEVVETLELNQFDFEGVMAQRVEQADKTAVGMPDDVDRSWGTILARRTEREAMKSERKVFIRRMLIQKYGEAEYKRKTSKLGRAGEAEFLDQMVTNYGDYINRTYLYWIATGRLGEVVGNASFKKGEFDLPQGIPEYYMKRDPRLLIWFLLKYTPVKVPEALLGLTRMGLPSYHSANRSDTANHFLSEHDNNEGAKGIRSTFYAPDMSRKKPLSSSEEAEKARHVKKWAELFKDALYNEDEYMLGEKGKEIKILGILKKNQKEKFYPRRNNSDTIARLVNHADTYVDDNFFKMINWDWAIAKYSFNKELVAVLSNKKGDPRAKFKYFAQHFNDAMFVTDALKAKRGDDPIKYRVNYQDNFFKAVLEYADNPEPEKLDALAKVVRSIVGAAVPEFRDNTMKVNYEILKERDPGEAYEVIQYKDGAVKFSENDYVGANAGEFPLPDFKTVVHDPTKRDIKTGSLASYRGLEGKVYDPEQLWDIMLRNMRGSGHFPEDQDYIDARKEFRKEQLLGMVGGELKWQPDAPLHWNLIYNGKKIWDILTLKKAVNALAMNVFEITPEMFWEWLFENTEKSWSSVFKYLSS